MEIISIIVFIIAVIWTLSEDPNPPEVIAARQRLNSMYDLAQHRYTNVAKRRAVRTIRYKISGQDFGTGGGGSTIDKS